MLKSVAKRLPFIMTAAVMALAFCLVAPPAVKSAEPPETLWTYTLQDLDLWHAFLEMVEPTPDGGAISEMLTHRIRNNSIGQKLAQTAVTEWRDAEPNTLVNRCEDRLFEEIKRAAMGK